MRASTVDVELLGRGDDVDRIRRAIAAGRSCFVSGPAGIGKSTILCAIADELGVARSTPIVHGLDIMATIPLAPWQAFLHGRLIHDDSDGGNAALVSQAVSGRIMLVDDVQWFDDASCELLCQVASSTVAIVTGRTPTRTFADRIAQVLDGADEVELGGLTDDDAEILVRRLRPGGSRPDVRGIVASCSGNPLFLTFSASTGDSSGGNPISVAVKRLDQRLLPTLALLAAAEVAVPVGQCPHHSDLVERGLATYSSVDSVRIAHACVSDAAREALPTALLEGAHRKLASMSTDQLVRVRHLGAAGDHRVARDLALAASESATSRAERAALLDSATIADEALAGTPDPALRVVAAEALVDAGRCDRGVHLARGVPAMADREGERRRLTAIARGAWSNDVPDKSAAREALALTDPLRHPMEAIQLLSLLTRIAGRIEWNPDEALEYASAALRVATDRSIPATEAHSAMATALLVANRPGWREHLSTALELARATGDPRAELVARDTLFTGELVFGDMPSCLGLAEATLARASALNVPFAADQARKNVLLARLVLAAEPASSAIEAADMLRRPLGRRVRDHASVVAALGFADGGDDLRAREVLARSLAATRSDITSYAMHLMARAEVDLAAGRSDEALTAAADCLLQPALGFPAHQMVAPTRAWAAHETGLSTPDPVGPGFPNVERFRLEAAAVGLLATDPEGAAETFRQALEQWGPALSRYTLRCRLGLAEADLQSGAGTACIRSTTDLVDICDQHGFVALARRARQLVRRFGGRAPHRPPSTSGLVTGGQEEMLALVLEGLTTAEIARRLRIAPSTVDSTLQEAQDRLGCRTRLDAAVRVQVATGATGRVPLRYSTQQAVVSAYLTQQAKGSIVEPLERAPTVPWQLSSAVVYTGSVCDESDAARALVGLLRGAELVVWLDPDTSCCEAFLDDARRIGAIEDLASAPRITLTEEHETVFHLLCEGATVAEIATSMHWSRRTTDRRIAALRETFGVHSTAELARCAIEFGVN